MTLPILEQPIFELTLPSTGQEIEYRPFLVQEEKLLLLAKEDKGQKMIITTLLQVIDNCVQSDLDSKKLTPYDVEWIFLNLRAKSVNSIAEIRWHHPTKEDQILQFEVNLDDAEIIRPEEHNDTIKLNDDVSVKLREITITDVASLASQNLSEKDLFKMMEASIDYIQDGDEVKKFQDESRDEVKRFLGQLPHSAFVALKKWYDTMPLIQLSLTVIDDDGEEVDVVLKGLNNFFQLG